MKTSLSPAEREVMEMFDAGMTGSQIAAARGETLAAVYHKRSSGLYKRKVATGTTEAPPELRCREEEETAQDVRERIAVDVAFDLRCQGCLVMLTGSDCEEAGRCVARSPDLLRGDSMARIARLWGAVERGRNDRE